jgi:hypothetical protein
MGNSTSLQKALLAFDSQIVNGKAGLNWAYELRHILQVIPFYNPTEECKIRFPIEYTNGKALDALQKLAVEELQDIHIEKNDVNYDQSKLSLILEAFCKITSAKPIYKLLRNQDISYLVLILKASLLKNDDDLFLQAVGTIMLVIERVGQKELKVSSKEYNQARREFQAKENLLFNNCFLEAIPFVLSRLHPGRNPLVLDGFIRLLLSFIGTHQDTTSISALELILYAMKPYHCLFWECSKSDYPGLRVSSLTLMEAIFLDLPVEEAASFQQFAIELGMLVFHLYFSIRPCMQDNDFAKPLEIEVQTLHKLWTRVGVPPSSSGASNRYNPSNPDSLYAFERSNTSASPASNPAFVPSEYDHEGAREASKEIVAVLCCRNEAAMKILERIFPSSIYSSLFATVLPAPPKTYVYDPSICDSAYFLAPFARKLPIESLQVTEWTGSKKSRSKSTVDESLSESLSTQSETKSQPIPPPWNFDRNMPVGVGPKGFLWYDAALSASPLKKTQKVALQSHVKVAWFGVSPVYSSGSHEIASQQPSTDPSTPVAESFKVSNKPAPLILQSAGDRNWYGFWHAIFLAVLNAKHVWTKFSLSECRLQLWMIVAILEKNRRIRKRLKLSSLMIGTSKSKALVSKSSSRIITSSETGTSDVSKPLFSSKPVPLTIDSLNVYSPFQSANPLIPSLSNENIEHSWDVSAVSVNYRSRTSLLVVDGIFLAYILTPLEHAAYQLSSYFEEKEESLLPNLSVLKNTVILPATFLIALLHHISSEMNPRRLYIVLHVLRLVVQSIVLSQNTEFCPIGGGLTAQQVIENHQIIPIVAKFLCDINAEANDTCVATVGTRVGGESVAIMNFGNSVKLSRPSRHWLQLWRQEIVLLMQYLLKFSTQALFLSSISFGTASLLPLLIVPADECRGFSDSISNPVVQFEELTSARKTASTLAMTNALRPGSYTVNGILTFPRACYDVHLGDKEVRGAEQPGGGYSASSFGKRSEKNLSFGYVGEIIPDVDVALVVSQAHISPQKIAVIAAKALLNGVCSSQAVASALAREDSIQLIVLSLLQSPQQLPLALQAILKLLRSLLPRTTLYAPALYQHGLYHALLLLTASPAELEELSSRNLGDGISEDQSSIGGRTQLVSGSVALFSSNRSFMNQDNASQSGTSITVNTASTPFGSLGQGGMTEEIAYILYENHLVDFDNKAAGWIESSYASSLVAALLSIEEDSQKSTAGAALASPVPETPNAPDLSIYGASGGLKSRSVFDQNSGPSSIFEAVEETPEKASSLAPFLPLALIQLLTSKGPDSFAATYNDDAVESISIVWSAQHRKSMLGNIHRTLFPLISWVRSVGSSQRADYESTAIVDSMKVSSGSFVARQGAIQVDFPFENVGPYVPSGSLFCIPGISYVQSLVNGIASSELDEEPVASGVYLRVYVSGNKTQLTDPHSFMKALLNNLVTEVSNLAAMHAAYVLLDPQVQSTNSDLFLNRYKVAQTRTLLTLKAIRRFLQINPGARLETSSYNALACIFLLPLARYPSSIANAVIEQMKSQATSFKMPPQVDLSIKSTISCDIPTPMPLPLSLLLPPDVTWMSSLSASNIQEIREAITGMPSGEDDNDVPGSVASAVVEDGDAESVLSVATDLLRLCFKPRQQKQVSKKAISQAVEAGLISACSIFIAWAIPLISTGTDTLLHRLGFDSNVPPGLDAANSSSASIIPSALDFRAMSPSQQLRLFFASPIVASMFDVLVLSVETDPALTCYIDSPILLIPLVRCIRSPLDQCITSKGAQKQGSEIVSRSQCGSALLRLCLHALPFFHSIASVFALRKPLLDLGVPLCLLQLMAGPSPHGAEINDEEHAVDVEYISLAEEAVSNESHVQPIWPIRQNAEAILKTLCDRVNPTPQASTPATLAPISEGDITSAIAAEVAAELEGGSVPPLQIEDAALGGGDRGLGRTLSRAGSNKSMSSPSRTKSFGSSLMRSVLGRQNSTGVSSSSLGRTSVSSASFSSANEKSSIRLAQASSEQLQTITSISNIVRNLLTPSLSKVMNPPASGCTGISPLSPLGPSVTSILQVLNTPTTVEGPYILWTKEMTTLLLRRISYELAYVDRRIVNEDIVKSICLMKSSCASFSGMSKASTPAVSSNPFGSTKAPESDIALMFNDASLNRPAADKNPFAPLFGIPSSISSTNAPSLKFPPCPIVWPWERLELPDLFRIFYQTLAESIVIDGVYVQSYTNVDDLHSLSPEPVAFLVSCMREIDAILSRFRVQDSLPRSTMKSLQVFLSTTSSIAIRAPYSIASLQGSSFVSSLAGVLTRDMYLHSLSVDETTRNGMIEQGWKDVVRNSLVLLVCMSSSKDLVLSIAPQLHAIHVLLCRAENEEDDGAPVSNAASSMQGSPLSLLPVQSNSVLLMSLLTNIYIHMPMFRASVFQNAIGITLLQIVTNSSHAQALEKRCLAVQCLCAGFGAVPAISASYMANAKNVRGWAPSAVQAALTLATPSANDSITLLSPKDETELMVLYFVAFLTAPLFMEKNTSFSQFMRDNKSERIVILLKGYLQQKQILHLWDSDSTSTDRAAIKAFLAAEGDMITNAYRIAPQDPVKYDFDSTGYKERFDRMMQTLLVTE